MSRERRLKAELRTDTFLATSVHIPTDYGVRVARFDTGDRSARETKGV
jgi:hypothetical protein